MVRLVLFDIDGTLIHTGGAGVKAFGKVFSTEFGVQDGFERLKFAGRTDFSLVREFFSFHLIPASPENFARFFDRYVFWLDHILGHSHTELCPGVWKFIRALQALPRPPVVGLLTGNIRLGAEIKLRHFGIWDVFETGGFADDHEDRDQIAAVARERGGRLVGGGDTLIHRRKAYGGQEGGDRTGSGLGGGALRDDEVLVVGDTPLDIRCGRSINAKVLAVATGGATFAELEKHRPDWVVPDLREVPAEVMAA